MEQQKPGVYRFAIPEPPAEHGTAQKIADMFATMEEVSFTRDIAPVLFEEFAYQFLEMPVCVAASEGIERAIDIARRAGHIVKCVPQFTPGQNGTITMCDLVYKRIGWP